MKKIAVGAFACAMGILQVSMADPVELFQNINETGAGWDTTWSGLGNSSQGYGINDGNLITSANGYSGDAYDIASVIRVNGTAFNAPTTADWNATSKTLTTGTTVVQGLTIQSKMTAFDNRPMLRNYVSFYNAGPVAITRTISWVNNWGSDSGTTIHRTSDNDASLETTDFWMISNDRPGWSDISGDPSNLSIFGDGSLSADSISPVVFSAGGSEGLQVDYSVTVGAGQTQSFVFHHGLYDSAELAYGESSSGFKQEYLAGLSGGEQASLVNVVIPEPATAGLLAISGLLIAAYRRIRKSYGV